MTCRGTGTRRIQDGGAFSGKNFYDKNSLLHNKLLMRLLCVRHLRSFARSRTVLDRSLFKISRRGMNQVAHFKYRRSDLEDRCLVPSGRFVKNTGDHGDDGQKYRYSEFDNMLLRHWKDAMEKGYFRYTLDHVLKRKIPGELGFLAHFNDKRTIERRKPQQITHIQQPFDPCKFNFTKIQDGEILFKLCNLPEDTKQGKDGENSNDVVIINDSPFEVGHVLLVPKLQQGLPQVLTEESVRLVLDMMLLSDHRGFRIAWNSLGALSSVNHLHFHGMYINHTLLAETMDVSHLIGGCYKIINQSTRGFAFQLHGQIPDSFARLVFRVSSHLVNNDVPHNVFITRGQVFCSEPQDHSPGEVNNDGELLTIRVFLWPKQPMFDFKDDPPFLNACVEPAGFLVIKDLQSYHTLTEEGANEILAKYSMTESEFQHVKQHACRLLENNP